MDERRLPRSWPSHRCPNCGQPGVHYILPSMAEPGRYTCAFTIGLDLTSQPMGA